MSDSEANSLGFRGTDQGYQMKSSPSNTPAWNGSNSSGFSGLAGGRRNHYNGGFSSEDEYGSFWSSSQYGTDAWARELSENPQVNRVFNNGGHQLGYSVRCIKD